MPSSVPRFAGNLLDSRSSRFPRFPARATFRAPRACALAKGGMYVANCRLRLVLTYSGSDAELITLREFLNDGQCGFGHSKGIWTAMRRTVVS
jgi:hypothetical protein